MTHRYARRCLAPILASLLVAGCSSGRDETTGGSPTQGDEQSAPGNDNAGGGVPPTGGDVDEPAGGAQPDDPEMRACIEECVLSRQMQATGIEIIREECRQECEERGNAPSSP